MTNQTQALRLLQTYTRGSFDPWDMMGPHNAARRAEVMTVLTGKRVPQSGAGVTTLRRVFHNRANVLGDYPRARDGNFAKWALEQVTA